MQRTLRQTITQGICLALLASTLVGCTATRPVRNAVAPVGNATEAVVAPVGESISNNPTTWTGAAAGVAVGALVGGPIGAVVGGLVGGFGGAAVDTATDQTSPDATPSR